MALFKSPTIASASGSLGGMTFSRNKGGMYIRARAVPVNPNTPFQQTLRSAVALLSNYWIDVLTAAQRDAWESYAAHVEVINALGDPMLITGLNHYIRSNAPRIQAGAARTDAAPTVFDLGEFTPPTFAVAATTDDVAVTFLNTDAWANENDGHMFVYASRPQNPTINYFKGPYRYADKINGDGVTPPTSPATINLPFVVEAGHKVFFRVRTARADARLAASFRDYDIAS